MGCVVGHGGGWGYSAHSVEAIRFCADADILLGGLGLFGGRGEYTAKIKVSQYKDNKSSNLLLFVVISFNFIVIYKYSKPVLSFLCSCLS